MLELNQRQLAELFGVTPRTVADWQADPDFPNPTKRGRSQFYDAAAAAAWWRDREINRLIAADDGDIGELSWERARLAHVQTERQRLLLSRERGELVAIGDIENVVGDDYSRVRARLLAVPPKCAPLAHRAESVAEIREILDDGVREALAELSDPAEVGNPDEAEPAGA